MKNDDYYNHPLFERHTVMFHTPMVKRFMNILEDFMWGNGPGCCFDGDYRGGKSWSIATIIDNLTSLNNKPIFCHHFTLSETDKSTRLGFQRALALSIGIRTKQGVDSSSILGDVTTYFEDQMAINKCSQAILFIDEADWLSPGQLNSAASVFNHFDVKKIDLRVVLIGNSAPIESLVETLQMNGQGKVLERFFKRRHELCGIKTMVDLEACLKCYDELKYPEGGLSYAQFFTKDTAGTDWTLTSLTALIWEIYTNEYAEPLKIKSWSMESFTSSIKTLLVGHLFKQGLPSEAELKKMVRESIEDSGLADLTVRLVKK